MDTRFMGEILGLVVGNKGIHLWGLCRDCIPFFPTKNQEDKKTQEKAKHGGIRR